MTKLFLALAFFISIMTLPWWVSTLCAIAFLAEGGNPLFILLGGFLLDEIFGAPIASLGGFSFIYTFLFALLGLVALYLRSMLLE